MNHKEWLDQVVASCDEYNQARLHTDFQEDEILKFVEFLHRKYGADYTKPKATHRNTPRE
jgi:hypothetical protein